MKIKQSVFKDEDIKDAITYKSWHWYLTMYCQAGCQDCTLLPYTTCSLQGYLGELRRSSGMDITLDDIPIILGEHNNNVYVLKGNHVRLGSVLIETPADSHGIIPRMLPSRLGS